MHELSLIADLMRKVESIADGEKAARVLEVKLNFESMHESTRCFSG